MKQKNAAEKVAAIDPALPAYLWAASCSAMRLSDDKITASHFAAVIIAANGSEAQELAWQQVFKRYPEAEGWDRHSVSLGPIPEAFIERAKK